MVNQSYIDTLKRLVPYDIKGKFTKPSSIGNVGKKHPKTVRIIQPPNAIALSFFVETKILGDYDKNDKTQIQLRKKLNRENNLKTDRIFNLRSNNVKNRILRVYTLIKLYFYPRYTHTPKDDNNHKNKNGSVYHNVVYCINRFFSKWRFLK